MDRTGQSYPLSITYDTLENIMYLGLVITTSHRERIVAQNQRKYQKSKRSVEC